MKKTLLLCFFVIHSLFALAQTSLSGNINIYAAVTAIDTCTATLTLEKSGGFTAGQDIIVIQMQGAIINTTNTANFGNVEELRSAGRYERARIRTVNGNQIVLTHSLLNTYNLDSRVQIVSLPVYPSAVITAELTCENWNGNTGGVLALEITDTLTFNASINVSGKGFRGGIAAIAATNNCDFLDAQNAYFYAANNWRGAGKGEGIALPTAGREAGRGAQSTGGGGGNDHNAGGGGGANVAGGGAGGRNNEPDFFGCDGNFPGIGGKAITDLAGRLFLGGGGGAGHENNDQDGDGGNGGGIVILLAKNIIGNNFKILANGETPATIAGDGAGGGGAGGTVLLQTDQLLRPLTVEAAGGDGGGIDNKNQQRCQGPGGGGSGGRLLAPNNLPVNYLLNRGVAGIGINSRSCPEGTNGAQPGGDGFFEDLAAIPQSQRSNAEPAIISQPRNATACIGQPLELAVVTTNAAVQYQWQIDRGDSNDFQDLTNNDIFIGVNTTTLTIANLTPELAGYEFRLTIRSNCFAALASEPIPVALRPTPTAQFDVVTTGYNAIFNNTSTNADEYFWDFGDGQTSEQPSTQHTYAQDGTFVVKLFAINDCDTAVLEKTINLTTEPTADFTAATTSGCQPLTVTLQNTSSANATSFTWLLPGGTPSFSTQRNPTVVYNASGRYSITLIASNADGIDTLRRDSFIVVNQVPTAAFTAAVNDLTITLTNTSVGGTMYNWNFGDGATSTDFNPIHTYSEPGNYTITLIAMNSCGNASITQNITIGTAPQALFTATRANGCAPHLVNFSDASTGTYESRFWEFPGGNPATSSDANPRVVYATPGEYDVRLTVRGALGSDTTLRLAYINVVPSPTPSFTYTVNGSLVTFNNTSTNASSYQWTFGDGQTSTQPNPVHNFSNNGVFTVTLNASNAYCGRSTSQTIAVGLNSAGDLKESGISIAPNPTGNQLFISTTIPLQNLKYRLYKVQGQLLQNGSFTSKTELSLSAFANGLYLLQLQSEDKIWVVKVVKQ